MTRNRKTQLAIVALLAAVTLLTFRLRADGEKKYDMKTYYMVFLKTGPNRSQSEQEAQAIQAAHLKNITNLHEQGKLAMAGPFMDDGDIRGIFVLSVGSMEEARNACDTDPAIKAGRLIAEIHPWYAAKGSTLP